jgi:hypothetical protein
MSSEVRKIWELDCKVKIFSAAPITKMEALQQIPDMVIEYNFSGKHRIQMEVKEDVMETN